MKIKAVVEVARHPQFVVSAEDETDRMLLSLIMRSFPRLEMGGVLTQDGQHQSFSFFVVSRQAAEAPEAAPSPAAAPTVPAAPAPALPALAVTGRPPRAKKPKPPRPPPVDFLNPERVERLRVMRDEFAAQERRSDGPGGPTLWKKPIAFNIRGTNGSGKTHLMRKIMGSFSEVQPMTGENDKTIGYILDRAGNRPTVLLGQYETACGGCDSFSGQGALDLVYDLVERNLTTLHRNVLFEGIIVCSDFRRTVDLVKSGFPLEIIMLDTPLEKCIENVNSRRAERGVEPLEDPRNIVSKFEGNRRSIDRFREAGVTVHQVNIEQAEELIRSRITD